MYNLHTDSVPLLASQVDAGRCNPRPNRTPLETKRVACSAIVAPPFHPRLRLEDLHNSDLTELTNPALPLHHHRERLSVFPEQQLSRCCGLQTILALRCSLLLRYRECMPALVRASV